MDEYIRLNLFFTKVHLIKTADGYIQFDGGMIQTLKKYLKLLVKHKINPEEIKLIEPLDIYFGEKRSKC